MSTLSIRPLTVAEINAMDSKTYDWHYNNNRENLHAALAPPPPPPTPDELAAQQRSEQVKELSNEFEEWVKNFDIRFADKQFRLDPVYEEARERALQLFFIKKQTQQDVDRFLAAHLEYIQAESNREELDRWLADNDLPSTFENLEKAFEAVKSDLMLDQSKIIDPDRPEMRPGTWKNGVFISHKIANAETGVLDNSTGTQRKYNLGASALHQAPTEKELVGTVMRNGQLCRIPVNQMSSSELQYACQHDPQLRATLDTIAAK